MFASDFIDACVDAGGLPEGCTLARVSAPPASALKLTFCAAAYSAPRIFSMPLPLLLE